MKRNGLGHLEAVISIVLFVIAVFIIIQLFFPPNTERISDSVAMEIFESIRSNASSDYDLYAVKISLPAGIVSIDLSDSLKGKNIIVTDSTGKQLPSKISDCNSGIICAQRLESDEMFMVKISENLTNPSIITGSCPEVDENLYSIASRGSRKVFSENKLIDLEKECLSNYEGLKRQLNMNLALNFAFNIELSDRTIVCEKKVLKNVQVNSLNTRIEILNLNGKLEYADFNLRIW